MTSKKTTSAKQKTRSTPLRQPSLYHRLDTLLHTMRCIAQYEDALCELSHEMKRAGDLSPKIRDEVREILDKVPADDYLVDLNAARDALAEPRPSKKPIKQKVAKPVAARKRSDASRKKSGKTSRR